MKTINFNYLPLRENNLVLDIGCGMGRHVFAAATEQHNIKIIASDLVHDNVVAVADQWQKLSQITPAITDSAVLACRSNIYALPFADSQFDVIICSEVLEHLSDHLAAIKELRRVLRVGGILAVSVPRAWPEKLCWFLSADYAAEPGGHVRIFNARQLLKEINATGLSCYRQHGAHALHSVLWWLKCLFWRRRDSFFIVRLWHRLLVWQLMQGPLWFNALESLLNPWLGKSVVFYFYKNRFLV